MVKPERYLAQRTENCYNIKLMGVLYIKNDTKHDTQIDWHSAFYDAIQMELVMDRNKLQFEREHPLNIEPLRPDVIIIKKESGAKLHQKFAEIFRGHNIIEYKSPEDAFSIADFIKTYSYPCIYQYESKVPYSDVTLTIVREAAPIKIFNRLKKELGFPIIERSKGIFEIKKMIFPIQIVVGKQLPTSENIWLKNLNTGKLDIKTLDKMRILKKSTGKTINMGAYFFTLFEAKEGLLKEVQKMGRASFMKVLEDMGLPEQWKNQGLEQGVEQGLEQGIEKGIDNTLEIIKKLKANIPPDKIATEFNIPEEKVLQIKDVI